MFGIIEQEGHPWRSYLAHCLLVLIATPIVGLANYWLTPIIGAGMAFVFGAEIKGRSISFAWIPAFILFAWAASEPITTWDASWSHMGHWGYFKNTMFGPNCGSSECLYTIFTAVLTGGVGYSLTGYILLRGRPKPTEQDSPTL